MILVMLLYSLCASSFTIAKAVLDYSSPIFFVAIRMLMGGVLLMIIHALLNGGKVRIAKDDWLLFFKAVVFHVYIAYVFDLWALQYLSSFKSSFFFNLSPFLTAILSYIIFGELLTLRKFAGMLIGFIGFLPLLAQDMPTEGMTRLMIFSKPEIFMLISVFASVYGWITVRQLVQKEYSPFLINGSAMIGGGALALLTSYIAEKWAIHPPVTQVKPFLALTILVVLVCNVAFYNLYGHLLKKYTATFLSFAGFTCPLFAALFGFIFLGEHPTWHFFVSSVIVALGLYIFYQEELRQGYVKDA